MSGVRYPLMGLAMLGLVLGLWAGLLRSGLPVPEAGAPAPLAHGPLMVSCFLGTLIALERALAVRSLASWLAPAFSGASVLALLPGYYRAAAALAVLAAVTAVGVHLRVRRRNPTPPLTLMTLGAAAWGAGNLLWLFAWAIPRVVPFWVVFLTLTVWGERLELSRFVLKEGRRLLFHSATVLLMAGAGLSLIRYQSGVRMMGAGLLTGVLWLLGRDLYRHTLRRPGQPGFTALSVLLGLLWLLGAGVGWLVLGGPAAGPRYDALLHSVFVGFVFSMIFAHAPVLAPLISGRPVPFSALLYLPLGLLHASLALRVFSDLAGWWQERAWGESIAGVWLTLERWGAAGNVAAIALFLLLIVLTLTRPPKPRTTLGSDPQISIFGGVVGGLGTEGWRGGGWFRGRGACWGGIGVRDPAPPTQSDICYIGSSAPRVMRESRGRGLNREKKSDAHGARARQLRRMRWQRRFRPLARWLNRHQPPEAVLLFSTALVVGLGVGFAEIFFHYLIDGVHQLSFEQGSGVLHFLGRYYVILIPALGGLLVGPMVYFVAPEAKGHGVPEVMEAVALRGGRIRPIVAVIKSVASAITIGSGGAAGREGPIVQIGSALGSTVGQVGQMSHDRTRMLVACGAAGGIAATFNAPVAGVLFALEIILGEFTAGHFSTVVVSSVTASVISRIFLGDAPAFTVPEYALESFRELPFYVILGLLAAPVGVAFSRVLYRVEDVFDAWKVPGYVKPALGGLGVGVVGLMVPQAFGVGYGAIESALHNQVLWGTAAIWLLAKLMATSLTLGSGGSGGVFAPGLFMGAMLGSTFGTGVHAWFPAFTAVPGAYALVGMSAVFASAANAPITAVLILFEMTGDYRIILPLMLATVISTLLARRIDPESIYTTKLSRRGIRLQQGRDIDVMQGVCVEEVMSRETSPVPAGMPVSELSQHFWRSRRHACPVLKEDGKLLGIVSVHDLEKALSSEDADKRKVGQIATRSLITIHPDEPVWEALNRMGPRDLSSLPVVDREDHGRLLGVIRRRDIVRAYNVAIMRREEIQQKVDQMQLRKVRGAQFVELEVEPGSSAADTPLSQLRLPRECIIVSIRRDTGVLIPHGETVLRPGDRITAFVEQSDEPSLRTAFAAATA